MAPKPIGSSAQYQDITQVLKGITDFYPPESCLRELLQNADDAGATEIEYVLDTRTYVTDPGQLIDPGLQGFQGPALLARNNAVFTESDIRSLCSVGVSGKRDDILVAGKFGRGFNSVYHWTDNPSIYSENRLFFQDPQHSWADSGGSVYETVHAPDDTEDPNCHKAKAQLQAFSQFPFDINSPYPGTIIRIPLRTGNQASTSKICRKETTTQQIRKFLLRFAQELGESGLLFVKHITKVALRVDKEELSVTQVLNVDEVCLSRQQVLHSLKSREDCSKSLEMEIRHFLGVNVSPQNRRYVIQHVLRRGSGDQSLDDWAREGKLLPWVAVAVQVNPLGSHPCSPKPLSSTLCLPKKIKQPAYMHGLWAIAPDRQRLSTESSGESWNKYLFSTLIATAWKDLLLYRNPLSPTNERFQFWPNPVETIEDPWDGLHDTIVESAINEDLPIWNTAFNCVNSEDAFFAEQKLENDNSAPALAKIGMPVVYLPSALYVLIREAPVKLQTLQPATALAYLHANIDKLLLASPEMKIKLLEYCFAAKAFAQLAEIPIWPLLSGSFANLKKSLTFLPRSVDEMELFRRSKPDLTIDVSKLTSQALKAMHHNHDKLFKDTPMRYRAITDLIEEWPTLYPISESSGFHVGRPTRLDKTLQGLWAWVSQRGSEIQEEDIVTVMGSFPDSLFLFPLRGDFVRHFASKSQDMPTLIVMDKELEALLVQVTKGSDVPPGILDESILQKAGLGLAERIGSKLPATQIETSENLFGFAPWLAAAKDLLLDLSDEDRRLLIKHISRVTKKRYDPSHGSMIANFLRQLPIFRKVVPRISVAGDDTSSFDYTWIDLSENHEYVSIANLPAVPTQTGVTFIDVSMAGMEKLARTFGLAKTLSVESLLRDYVLPAIEGKSIEKVSEKRLIEFILEASAGCSNEWRQTLAKARVIPSRSLENTRDLRAPRDLYDPTSRNLQRLFFMDETVFPDSDIFKTYHILLKQCGLHTEISSDIIKSRIRYFEKTRSPLQELEDKVSYLVQTPLTPHELRDKAFMIEVQSKRWVPAFTGPTMVKLSPKDCRPSGLAWLVSQTHGLVRFSVSPSWHQLLGWDKAIDFQTLLKQLSKLIEENKVLEVQKVLDYIEERCSPEEYVPELTSMRCIPGSQGLYVPSKVFSSENRDLSRLSPHVDILHPAVTFSQIHKNLGVQAEFTLETLLTVQECILTPGLFLSNQDLDVAVAILHLASSFPRDQLADLMGPTQDCKMVNIAELTIGGDKERLSEFQVESLYFVHDRVSLETLSKLQIDTLRDRMIKDELKIDEEDDDEYTPQEELTTVLSDCLRRYPPATAFNEYVANAEDCRASKLAWTIDDCEACTYPTERLMTKELECVQGPSLFVYNDGVFSEADFEGFKQIGRGSKSESETSIGMYGRGAITMYHFTDVPMILSGSTFLILDPQQTLLPRNKFNKRKVGVKVSLTRARRAFPDHLVPFEGLWGYTAATDHFNGTIFRFPFRIHSQVSSLVDGAYFLTIEKIKMLLEKYFKTAQVAMLFLKNVRSLCYRRRADEGHRWYVQSIPEPFSEKNLIQKMIIKSWDLDKSSYTDHWLIATHDNNVPAQMVTMDIPSKLRHKKIQCGVAACPASTYKTEHSIFCTLPTAFTSSLPVSFHGIFAITGDRQTIPHGDTSRGNESQWNKWLLAQCIPQLYLGFLQETCKRWPDLAYRLWPNGTVDETSKVVRDSFWAMLGDKQNSSLRLFPLVSSQELIAHGNRSTAVSLHDAQFEFLQDNSFKKLKPLLLKLFPKLVKLPANLHGPIQQLIKSGKIKKVAYLSEQYLCEIFQDEDACEKLKTDLQVERKVHAKETWINLMNNMIPASNLNSFAQMISVGSVGCRILPTRSGKLGKLMPQCNSCAATTYLRGTINETEVFSFAGDLFVDNEFEKPIVPGSGGGPTILSPLDPIISSGLFNVRKMEAKDAGGLLKHADSPLTNASPAEKHRFLFNFWEYFNPKLTALLDTAGLKDSSHKEALEQCGLEDMPIYATGSLESPNFIAPADFDDGPYMLEPSTPANRSLCEKIPGLQLVHRFLVPKALREAEMDICSPPSFKRFIRCLMRLTKNDPEAIEEFVATNLKHEQLKLLRGALSDYLPQGDDNSLLPVLRMLPVWPRMETAAVGPSKQYISAQNATVVQDKDMIHPWVKDLETWIDPETSTTEKHILDKLGKKPLPMKDVWKKVSADFPPDAVLAQTQFEKYRNFIETLKKGDIKPEIPIAPDGTGKLCRPKFLFDDTESIFMAAFRLKEDTKFIHKDVRSFKEYWKLIGLRHRRNDGAIRQHDYRACIKSLHERSTSTAFSMDPDFLADARHVLEYVTWKRKEFDIWESSTWKEIVTTPVFKVKPHHDPMSYRQPRMRELAAKQDYISVDAAGLEKYLTISWSQVPFLDLEPVPLAYGDIPRQGAPSVDMVVQHLEFLVRIREIVPKIELTSFLEDVQASYAHLQKYCHQLNSKHKAATAAIWLNLETTDVEQIAQRDLDTAATTVSRLCFHCPVDPPGMRRVRAFLIPYERLLKALGTKIVVQPPIPAPTETDADKQSPKEVTMDSISALRAENRFFDVTLKVDNDKREIQAHRLVLGASSSFFRASSSAVWKQPFITVSEVSFEDLKTILDFFYTGVVSLPAVSDQEPVASIADKLDHCLDLLHTADYLQIPRLHRTLENFILKESRVFVRPDNVRHLIKLADQDNAKNLKKYCVVYEEKNRDVVEGCEQLEADEGNS